MGTKLNIDRKPVPDEEINSHKDFGELVKKFKQQSIEKARSDVSFFKNKKITYSTIIAGAVVICTVTYFSVFKKEPPKETSHDKIVTNQQKNTNTVSSKLNKAFIAPPISKLNVPYTSYKVNSEQGATIKHKSNSKIIIPKKAFVNKQGQDIVGDVEIKYREFHNQADIIVSGIPMAYDSAGIQSHLESAGMIDIKGYQNGEPVYINPKKQITVEFASSQVEDKYNMYYLDTIAQNWVYLSRDNSLKGQQKQEVKTVLNKEQSTNIVSTKQLEFQKKLDAIPPKIELEKVVYAKKLNQLPKTIQPNKPLKSIEGRPKFELDVDYKEFPELAAFKSAVFEVGTENKNYNPKLADITWSSAAISEGPQKGRNYLLMLKLGERAEKLIVYPALTGADYENALKIYELKFANYKELVVKREADEKRLKEEFEAKQAVYLSEQKRLQEEITKEQIRIKQQQAKDLEKQFTSIANEERIMRVFTVSNFGIFNSDCPNSLPKGASINPIYVTNDKHITPNTIYLICHTKNLVYNLRYGQLPFNPKEKYSLCVIIKERVYLCSKEKFSEIITANQNKIPLTEMAASSGDMLDFKKAIGI